MWQGLEGPWIYAKDKEWEKFLLFRSFHGQSWRINHQDWLPMQYCDVYWVWRERIMTAVVERRAEVPAVAMMSPPMNHRRICPRHPPHYRSIDYSASRSSCSSSSRLILLADSSNYPSFECWSWFHRVWHCWSAMLAKSMMLLVTLVVWWSHSCAEWSRCLIEV